MDVIPNIEYAEDSLCFPCLSFFSRLSTVKHLIHPELDISRQAILIL